MGFIRDLVQDDSVGFVEAGVEHVGLFFVAKKAGAQRFIIDACASNRLFFILLPDRCSQKKDSVMSNFRERLRTLKTDPRDPPTLRMRFIRCAFPDGCKRSFALPAVLASEIGYAGNTIHQKRLAPDSLILLVPTTLPMGFSWAMFFVKMSRTHVRLRGVLILLFLFGVTTPHQRCSVANMAWDRLVSAGRMLSIFRFWRAGQTASTFISHVYLQV